MNFFRIIIFFFLLQFKAYALIEVDITRGNLTPLPIAVSPLSLDKSSIEESKKILNVEDIGSEISLVVENNLKTSGLFSFASSAPFILANKKQDEIIFAEKYGRLYGLVFQIIDDIIDQTENFKTLGTGKHASRETNYNSSIC